MKYFPGKVARCLLLTMMIWLAGILSVQAIPPVELGLGLTDAAAMDSSIVLDIKYATADNFTGQILYPSARCLLREPVAERLLRVQSSLRLKGLGLKVFDCYRPIEVQRKMWRIYLLLKCFSHFPQSISYFDFLLFLFQFYYMRALLLYDLFFQSLFLFEVKTFVQHFYTSTLRFVSEMQYH